MSTPHPADSAKAADSPNSRSRPPYVDAAVIVTLGSAAMYFLGWRYSTAFLRYFGIASFIEMDTYQVVATTWPILFVVGSILVYVWPRDDQARAANRGLVLSTASVLRGLAVAAVWVLYITEWGRTWVVIPVAGVTIAVFLVTEDTAFGRRPWIELHAPSPFHALFLAVLGLGLLGSLCDAMGRHAAVSFISEGRAVEVRFDTQYGTDLPKKGLLIAHMRGKYFVYERTSTDARPGVHIIDDSIAPSVLITPR